MIKRVNDVAKRSRSKGVYIYRLMAQGRIHKDIDEGGYVCFDIDEFNRYQIISKRGKPPKKNENTFQVIGKE